MIETLRCNGCGERWTRELQRGRKPRLCPDCLRASVSVSNSSDSESGKTVGVSNGNGSERLTERQRTVPDDVVEILTTNQYVDPELRRKLEYIVAEIEGQRREPN